MLLNGVEQPNTVGVTKLSNQPDGSRKSVWEIAKKVANRMCFLSKISSNSIESYIQLLAGLEKHIVELTERDLPKENSTIVQFLRLIIENKSLQQKLKNLNNCIKSFDGKFDSTSNKGLCSQLFEFVKEFKLLDLGNKVYFLALVKEKKHFATIVGEFDEWDLYDLTTNENFKQKRIEAINEESDPFSSRFKKDMDQYMETIRLGKKVIDQYFKDKEVRTQAYCETKNGSSILHANFINYHGAEPIRTSDILKHDKNIQQLSIYCNTKREVEVYREGQARNYDFVEGANYKMTSIWPAKDGNGKCCNCKMVMHIDSNGITKIVEFAVNDNRLNSSSEGFLKLVEQNLKLIEQNKELYIKHQSLGEAVKKFLGLQQNSEHEKVLNKEEITPVPKVENKECSPSTESSTASDPSKDLVAIRKKLRELNIELANLEKKVKRAKYVINENVCLAGDLKSQIAWVENLIRINQEIDSRYDESKDIRRKLGELRQLICEVKERSKGPEWDKGNVSSLGTLCILTNQLHQNVNEAYFSIEVLQQKFRANLLSSDVEKFIKQHSKLISGVEYIDSIKHDGNGTPSSTFVGRVQEEKLGQNNAQNIGAKII
ncbi:hypothetical protein [Wolbachia endosymbiont of Ctenocephalides felis wCfeJ]|uniref:hypothetical protein n=1 Tax=Wolbachia endosymbiont of Ctenocephalides felis wCfeJ TaxID=2732594 RepID=UPI001446E666|nr:hypothetical protein [Wolbachia endosymbiont of Ctenocephalides felis wCfeJ]WCR58530.1 MAG: hypothetical protein PG980_001002 [Wolbachia endosymbiont of Ctenocephalides felis wCfeJ]